MSSTVSRPRLSVLAVAIAGTTLPLLCQAQASGQLTKPPKATAYIDLATYSSDIPGMGMMAGMARGGQSGGMFGALGGMMRGGGGGDAPGGNTFGSTHAQGFGAPGKYVDISVSNLKNPALQEAGQVVVPSFFGTPLKLVSPPPPEKPLPAERDDAPEPPQMEKPKPNAKISLYWGCGDSVRPGQPRTLDMSKSTMDDYMKFFTMRSSQSRGARLRYGEPSWPNKQDDRRVPESAQLAGDHQISGDGMPDTFKFVLDDRQDFLSPIRMTQQKVDGAVQLEWDMVTYARGYFISVLGGQGGPRGGGDGSEVVMWTSSELPEMGYALVDYQTNGAIEGWLKEKVLLPPTTTKCTVPKGIFGDKGAGMLRMIAYGSESYLGYPKRPTDPKIPYEPDWQVKVRTKSTFFSMLGGMPNGRAGQDGQNPMPQEQQQQPSGVGGLLKGLFGR
jgi:hypothetical protein